MCSAAPIMGTAKKHSRYRQLSQSMMATVSYPQAGETCREPPDAFGECLIGKPVTVSRHDLLLRGARDPGFQQGLDQ